MNIVAPRFDIYRLVHKALRACMSETLAAVGRMDPEDEAERNAALTQVREMLVFCRGHLQKEDAYVHPVMEARAPGSSERTAGEHGDHAHWFDDLDAAAASVESAQRGATALAAAALYRRLALFVGENFVHMDREETENNQVLWRTHSDAELVAIERAIIASLSPQEKAFTGRWMLPALSPAERADVLSAMRQSLPTDAFAGILAMLRPQLSATNWWKLSVALGATGLAA